MNVHHVPLVAAARPLDLLDRAKHLLDSANVGEPQGSLRMGPPGPRANPIPASQKNAPSGH